MEKCCINCYAKKPIESFSVRKDTGKRRGQCRECEYADRDEGRKQNLHKDRAKTIANNAIKSGVLKKKDNCEVCNADGGETGLIKHHEDYNRPLFIMWLCRSCHSVIHAYKKKMKW